MTRRRSLQTVAASAATGAVAFTGCEPPRRELLAQSRVLAEDALAADETWYATLCRQCPAGCGLIVRVVEGRAKKAEGNPDHPLNRGKLCARGQAVVQEQYHPDRIRGPLVRAGSRGAQSEAEGGAGRFSPTTWDRGVDDLAARLHILADGGRAGDVVLLTPPLRGHQALLAERFTRAYGAQWLTLQTANEAPLRAAVGRVFGQDGLPHFDLQNARFVLSFGADFLSTWLSPVHYAVAYGIFRQGNYRPEAFQPRGERPRGYLVQVEPRLSATAANADEWVPVRPGREARLALGLAQVVLAEGLAQPQAAQAFGDVRALEAYRPERVAGETGVPAERIRQLARDFASRRPSLALAGGVAGAHTNGTETAASVLALNALVGSVGAAGGVRFNPPPIGDPSAGWGQALTASGRVSSLADWQQLAGRLRSGQVQAVLVYQADPVHGLPPFVQFREALLRAPFVVSFSGFRDDTTELADLVLPAHLPLEDWGDDLPEPAPGESVLTLQQPVLRPLYDTRSFWDTLLALAEEIGGPVREALPWASFKDLLREAVRALPPSGTGAAPDADFERFWVGLLQRGGWWDSAPLAPSASPAPVNAPLPAEAGPPAQADQQGGAEGAGRALVTLRALAADLPAARFAGAEADFPFHLVVFPHHTLGSGEGAHLPWLQAAPDPVTSVVWQTWVEVNPRLAQRLGVHEGDVVRVESPQGRIEVPVYVHPAAPPDVLAIPVGQGHAAAGRWAERRGPNPLALLAPLVDDASGALAYAATRVRLAKTGRRIRLPKLEGNVPAYQLPGQPVIKVTRRA